MDNPTVFISYSHDDKQHEAWVLKLATDLRSHGVNAILDQWDLRLGSDLVVSRIFRKLVCSRWSK